MTNLRIYLILSLLIVFNVLNSQNVDSLKVLLKTTSSDTVKCAVLNVLIDSEIDDQVWVKYNNQYKIICEENLKKKDISNYLKKFYLTHLGACYSNIAYMYSNKGDISTSLDYNFKALKIKESVGDKDNVASSLNNIGAIYENLGDIPKALEYFHKCLKIVEEIGDEYGTALSLGNIGLIYSNQGDYKKAEDYYQKSLKTFIKIGNEIGEANAYNNLGTVYGHQNSLTKSLNFFLKGLEIQEKLGDKVGISNSLVNIGLIYKRQNNSNKALDYYNKALILSKETQDKEGQAFCFISMANAYESLGNTKSAKLYAQQSLILAKELGYPTSISDASELLSRINFKLGNYKDAYEMQLLYKQMSDSINNETNKKASIQKSFQYQYEKKAATDSIKQADEKKVTQAKLNASEALLKQEKTQRFALYGGLALVLLFTGFIFNRFKVTQKQKQIIELKEKETQTQNEIILQQKDLVEEKHKEITDSINYAERIQRSFMATTQLLNDNLKDYFVFFQPKDVVSGDFYWASKIVSSSGAECFALVTADSTGHGVPGAIMSILNISCLEKSIDEKQITEPAEILNHTRTKIIERLSKDGSPDGGKDGMDCSLVVFDFNNRQLTYSAANNPVWIVRSISSIDGNAQRTGDAELIELNPDKMPVGKHDKDSISFMQHTVTLQKGDVIYTFTDGMPDQFGGPKGKKFMYKQLKQLLIDIAPLSMSDQKIAVSNALNSWKGNTEQVDDVLIIGVRI